jgi:hypothetical protein
MYFYLYIRLYTILNNPEKQRKTIPIVNPYFMSGFSGLLLAQAIIKRIKKTIKINKDEIQKSFFIMIR